MPAGRARCGQGAGRCRRDGRFHRGLRTHPFIVTHEPIMLPPTAQIDTQQLPSAGRGGSRPGSADVTIHRRTRRHRWPDRSVEIFVDELQRFAAEAGDSGCAAIADRLATPLRVAVSGRPGVGRRTVGHALARAGVTCTEPPEADLDVYVVAEVVKPEDRAAICAARRPVVVVLNKADLIATAQPGLQPHGPTRAARSHCARLAAHIGLPIEPAVGLLAVAALDDLLDDTLWAALQLLAAGRPVAAELQRRLLDTLDVFGVAQALTAIRSGANRDRTRAVLRGLSCIDDLVDKIGSAGAQVNYERMQDALAELETLAVTDLRIGQFLSHDDTVVARMAVAVRVVEAAGMNVDGRTGPGAHLRRATAWQRYSRGPVSGLHRACAAEIVRGSLRLWSKAGS
jgi:hypothetical protein